MWIESLNTVMDDNKILTLASNERIAVTPEMKLLFEISNLRTATPATVSREDNLTWVLTGSSLNIALYTLAAANFCYAISDD